MKDRFHFGIRQRYMLEVFTEKCSQWKPPTTAKHSVKRAVISSCEERYVRCTRYQMTLTTVGLPLLISWLTSWKILLQSIDLSKDPLFTMTATANRICSRTYF